MAKLIKVKWKHRKYGNNKYVELHLLNNMDTLLARVQCHTDKTISAVMPYSDKYTNLKWNDLGNFESITKAKECVELMLGVRSGK